MVTPEAVQCAAMYPKTPPDAFGIIPLEEGDKELHIPGFNTNLASLIVAALRRDIKSEGGGPEGRKEYLLTIYPAIDLKDGQCVRLAQGDMDRATVYGDKPGEIARAFQEKGAEWLHVVDLDGAFAGESINTPAVEAILKGVDIPMQLGGGIRSLEKLEKTLELGVSRAILGTAALEDGDFVKQAVARYGSKIAVGIDARDGFAAVKGWAEMTETKAIDLALRVGDMGARTIIYTDISRDGMLTGPNFEATESLIRKTGLDVIVSGGIADLSHIATAREIGAAGVIIGRALYTGAVKLEDAVAEGRKPC